MPIFSWSPLVFGSIAWAITGSGKVMRSSVMMAPGSQRIASGDVFQADAGGDVAGVQLVDVLTIVGVHLHYAADALLLPLIGL